jgi:DNA polymerase III delta subunit
MLVPCVFTSTIKDMLYFFYGKDVARARAEIHKSIDALRAKKENISLVRIEDEAINEYRLDELIKSQGLFESKNIVFFDNSFGNKQTKETILKKLNDMARSNNAFFFLEGEVDKTSLAKISKHSDQMREFSRGAIGKAKTEPRPFNIFLLTDALGRRDRKAAWVLYQKAKLRRISPEEIHNVFCWQVKNMILAKESGEARQAGVSPFVFRKAKAGARNYTAEELINLLSTLVSIYHNVRRGICALDPALEQFILRI